MKRLSAVIVAIVVAVVMVGLALLWPVQAAPPAAVTPVANVNARDLARVMNFMLATRVTTNTRACQVAGVHEVADIQYVIDQATATNTLTLTLQYSNDAANFTSGPDLVGANSADADSLAQYAVFGQYACIYATVANTNPVTVTVIGLGK